MKKISPVAIFIFLLSALQLSAQRIDSTAQQQFTKFKLTALYLPTALIAGGVALNGNAEEGIKKEIAEERNEHFFNFRTHIDNYLQFSPIAIAYGLDALGCKSKTALAERSIILLRGELLMTGTVFGLKKMTCQLRPDNSARSSFPSGHTAQAFAAAAFLSEEYKARFKWMPYAAYGIASTVGMMRMANNKHYISDVLVGAGLGILSMKTSYWTRHCKKDKKQAVPTKF